MRYIVSSVVVFASVFLVGSCSDSKKLEAGSHSLTECEAIGPEIQRCENQEVTCYVLVGAGISCLRK